MKSGADAQKKMLRADLRERRLALGEPERLHLAELLTQQLQQLVQERNVTSLSAFLSTPTEPDVRPFVAWARNAGIRVLLPVSRDDGLLDWAVATHEGEASGLHGMPEPTGERLGPIAVGEVDLMLIPAAAVDTSGMRLGWGRGYYDKTLGSMNHRPPVFAVVFDHEVLPEVPRELHDQPVDGVVTPNGITYFRKKD